jgi:1,4-alpha-glucan branching enzyme
VKLDGPLGEDLWGRAIVHAAAGSAAEIYYLTHCGRFGALPQPGASGFRFSLWAPNARSIDLVLADPAHGYVADDGAGVLESVAMTAQGGGIWAAVLDDFPRLVGRP